MKKIKQNIPNMITISRIISSIVAPISILMGNIPLAVILYIYGAISDCLDGLAARKLNAFTELGRKLDPISDKLYALSLLSSTLILGNYLMLIPLALEGEIAATTISAKNSNINLETERVGKYKTWLLFASIIIGLLATIKPVFYFPLAPLLGYTSYFQIQSIKAYENQFYNKLNKTNSHKIDVKLNEEDAKKENIKEKIESHYNEFMFYKNIPIESNRTKPKKLQKVRKKNNNIDF